MLTNSDKKEIISLYSQPGMKAFFKYLEWAEIKGTTALRRRNISAEDSGFQKGLLSHNDDIKFLGQRLAKEFEASVFESDPENNGSVNLE